MNSSTSNPMETVQRRIYNTEKSLIPWYSHFKTPNIKITETQVISRKYSRIVLESKVYKPSILKHSMFVITMLFQLFVIYYSFQTQKLVTVIFIIIFLVQVYLRNPWHPSLNKTLEISKLGILWGDTMFGWTTISSTYIVTRNYIRGNKHSMLYILTTDNNLHAIPLKLITGFTIHDADIASAIENFREQIKIQ